MFSARPGALAMPSSSATDSRHRAQASLSARPGALAMPSSSATDSRHRAQASFSARPLMHTTELRRERRSQLDLAPPSGPSLSARPGALAMPSSSATDARHRAQVSLSARSPIHATELRHRSQLGHWCTPPSSGIVLGSTWRARHVATNHRSRLSLWALFGQG